MAWNEPGNDSNKDKDPWGGGNKNQGPPDLDEALKKGLNKLNKLLGGKSGNSGKGGSSGGSGSNGNGAAIGSLLVVILLILVVALGFMSVYTVNTRERAIVLRFGKYYETVGPGLQFKIPFVDRIDKVDVTKVRSATTKGQMLTADDNIVEVKMTVQYVVSDPKAFTLDIRNPERTLDYATDSALRQEVGRSELHSVLTEGRSVLAVRIQDQLQVLLKYYKTGLQISKVNIEDTMAPSQVRAAFQDVQRAKEDQQRVKEEAQTYQNKVVPEARGKAQRIIEEAIAYKSRIVLRAEGDASRFTQLLKAYDLAPAVTRERLYIDAMQKIMSKSTKILLDTKGSNNVMYLPIDKLISNKTQSSGSNRSGASTNGNQTNNVDINAITNKVLSEVRARQNDDSLRGGRP